LATAKKSSTRGGSSGKAASAKPKVESHSERLQRSTRELARQGLEQRALALGFRDADDILGTVGKTFGLSPEGRQSGRRFREQARLMVNFLDAAWALLEFFEKNRSGRLDLDYGLRKIGDRLHFMARPYPDSCHFIFRPETYRLYQRNQVPSFPEDASTLDRVVRWSLWGGRQAEKFRLADVARVALLLGYFPETGNASLRPQDVIDRAASAVRMRRKQVRSERERQILREQEIRTRGGSGS
jgi:hypothetical protein